MKTYGYSALRKGRVSLLNHIYHISFFTQQRRPFFHDLFIARYLINAMQRQSKYYQTICFVVMPDHVHWLFQLTTTEVTISEIIRRTKTSTSKYFKKNYSGRLWQEGFYDRALRKEDDIVKIARYIIANPVRAKLVSKVGMNSHWDAIFF